MADHVDRKTRSAIMSRVRSKDTTPEIQVRKALHKAGFRFRLHRSSLPGKPDLVFSRYRLALFVHGCFWHRHGCKRTTTPATNTEFWTEKFRRTLQRDKATSRELEKIGWTTLVIWECQIKTGIDSTIEILTELRSLMAGRDTDHQSQTKESADRDGGPIHVIATNGFVPSPRALAESRRILR